MESHSPTNEFEVLFKGLSDECPSVFEVCVEKVFDTIDQSILKVLVTKPSMQQATVVTSVYGWYGIGTERLAKYVAKIGMESKRFNRLVWMIGFQNEKVVEEFQMRVAEILQIPFKRNYYGEEDAEGFEVLARKIHACLEQQKFLLVHYGSWQIGDLKRMGIPSTMSAGNYSMVLATSTVVCPISIDSNLPKREFWDLLWEESADISATLSLRQVNISSENVMKCILYFGLVFYSNIYRDEERSPMPRCWFAEGFIGDVSSDLESTFNIGITLFKELKGRQMLSHHFFGKLMVPGSYRDDLYEGTVFDSTLVKRGKWEEDYYRRICFRLITRLDYYPFSSDCTNLTSIFLYNPVQGFSNKYFESAQNVRVLYFVSGGFSSIPSFVLCFQKTLKLLRIIEPPSLTSLEVSYLATLEKLEILELSNSLLKNLPDNLFQGLHNLRLLDLSEFRNITSLPTSLSLLSNLEHLLLRCCRSLSILPSSLPLPKLKLLDLSITNLTEIPTGFFQHLLSLKNLSLSWCKLKSLPTSISNLVNLKELELKYCRSLVTVVPSLGQLSSSLEVLNLLDCSSLTDTTHLSSSFRNMPNLRVLNLGGINLDFLTLNGCSSLESIMLPSNENLMELDLSGTKIKKFPLEDYPTTKSLRSLTLLGVRNLCSVNWNTISWLPAKVKWDQCGDGSKSNMHIPLDEWFRVGNGDGVFISVCNANVFQSLKPYSSLWMKGLSRFVIYIHPCIEKSVPPLVSSYKDIYSKLTLCFSS